MERKGKGAVRWLQCSSVVLLGWCWCAATELNFAFLLFPSSLGLASCNSVSRSLLPVPSAEGSICLTEKCYCVLVDFILRVTTTRFQQAFTVTDEGQSCVDWAASAVCSYKVVISACLIARLLRRQFAVAFASYIRIQRDTWLILPVVICLSQRLSHACLSTSLNKVKPRMAH